MHQVSILNQRLKPKKLQFRKYPKYDLKVHLKNRGVDDKSDFIDFTLSNARRFYSSNARPPGSEREKKLSSSTLFSELCSPFPCVLMSVPMLFGLQANIKQGGRMGKRGGVWMFLLESEQSTEIEVSGQNC